jgi:hypothetical protein
MHQEFDATSNVHVDRDLTGAARNLLHVEQVYPSKARTAQLAAREYLEKFGPLVGIKTEELQQAGLRPERAPVEAGIEYRFLEEKPQFDSVTVTFAQTFLGLKVWDAGVAVHMLQNPFRVVSAQSTLHADVDVQAPREEALRAIHPVTEELLTSRLGLEARSDDFDRASLRIERQELYVYRYEADKRALGLHEPSTNGAHGKRNGNGRRKPTGDGAHEHEHEHEHLHLVPPLPPVPETIEEGRHYVVAAVTFVLGVPRIPDLRWIALVEAETKAILLVRAFIEAVDGLVFVQDPMTVAGGPTPAANNAALNPLRSAVILPGLQPPLAGTFKLTGDIVQVKDVEAPPIAPPVEPPGTDFDFNARTNNFAAVNAYYHNDRFFRLVRDLGFDLSTYFGGTIFPTVVDHRGLGGAVINAHCLGNGAFGIMQTAFALADLTNVAQPLGIACDWRVVLHELGGHGILYNHINWPNFPFSHSAGDSFGAMLNDPDSVAPDRFLTFPWVNIGRRHDRTPAAGWGWAGNIALHPFGPADGGGYNNEQILCTTHFRLYRSIGGDATELATRNFAARYVSYLILRAVGSMTPATKPPNALAYASQLTAAELGTWTSEDQVGGCYWKVIRWAFEKQGLYQPIGTPTPNNHVGSPPPVDVFIDDGRHGEYTYGPAGTTTPHVLQKFWETTDVWNRHKPDGGTAHQTPVVGRPNYAYVRVKNRGTTAATNVTVHGWHCRPTAGLVWPDDLQPMATTSLTVPHLASGGQTVVGPFEWRPRVRGHECMLMSVSAPGDRANNDPASFLPAAAGPTPLWRMVPNDNNLGLRAVVPVPGGGHRRALVRAFHGRRLWAANPLPHPAKMEVRAILSPFLTSRAWDVRFDNPGGGSFTLGPRATRLIRPRLVSGQDFNAGQVGVAGPVAIEIVVLADGIVVGGITYALDPQMTEPAREVEEERAAEAGEDEERAERAEKGANARHVHVDVDLD